MTILNTIIITTSLTVIFGAYSFYGLFYYLDKSGIKNNNYVKEIVEKYNEIEINYKILLKENIILKVEIETLSKKVTELENKKLTMLNCVGNNSLEDVLEDVVAENRIICNADSENNPKINVEIINLFVSQKEPEEAEEVKSQYESEPEPEHSPEKEHGFEVLDTSYANNEHIVKSRMRGTSISEINWAEVTKKFIFG